MRSTNLFCAAGNDLPGANDPQPCLPRNQADTLNGRTNANLIPVPGWDKRPENNALLLVCRLDLAHENLDFLSDGFSPYWAGGIAPQSLLPTVNIPTKHTQLDLPNPPP